MSDNFLDFPYFLFSVLIAIGVIGGFLYFSAPSEKPAPVIYSTTESRS